MTTPEIILLCVLASLTALAVTVILRKKLWKCACGISCGGNCEACHTKTKKSS